MLLPIYQVGVLRLMPWSQDISKSAELLSSPTLNGGQCASFPINLYHLLTYSPASKARDISDRRMRKFVRQDVLQLFLSLDENFQITSFAVGFLLIQTFHWCLSLVLLIYLFAEIVVSVWKIATIRSWIRHDLSDFPCNDMIMMGITRDFVNQSSLPNYGSVIFPTEYLAWVEVVEGFIQ